ncbi:MAG: SLC13 family permease [Peptococcaceae bacterium]|nr:SLC13 family permease [Peptococcaceae bacterium]
MTGEKNPVTIKRYIHFIVTAVIIFGARLLPPIAPITEEGMVILGAFIGAMYGWTFIDMLWPSILAMFSMGMELGVGNVVAAGLGNTVTWMLIFFYIIIGILTECHIVDTIAAWFLTRKITKGKPWFLYTIMVVGCFFCSMLNGFGSLIIFLALTFKMCELMNIKPYSKFPTMMAIGIVLSVALAAIMFPFKGTSLTMLIAWQGITGLSVDYVKYMVVSFPIGLFILLIFVLISRFVIRVDVMPLKQFDPKKMGIQVEKLTMDQKLALVIVVWAILDLIIPSLLPKTISVVAWLDSLTVFGQVALPVLVFMVIQYKNRPVIEFSKIAAKYVPWELFMMMGVIMPLTSFLTADTTGIKPFMTSLVQPLMGLGAALFIIILMALTVFLTNFANNAVVGMIMMPVIYAFSTAGGGLSPTAALMILIFCCHFAFLTPGATPFAAIMFSNTKWVRSTNIFKYGIPTILLLFGCTLPVCYFWSTFILG